MEFTEVLNRRYSVRKLSSRPVEQEKIDAILHAAKVAPTAVNYQPFKVWVGLSEEAREKMASTNNFAFVKEAPVIFVIGGDPETAWKRKYDGHNFVDVDSTIAATQMMLEIENQGLGTTWVGFFDAEKMAELFPEMKGYHLTCLFGVGYPAEDPVPSEKHSISKPDEELFAIL